jgi:hypothetical protein
MRAVQEAGLAPGRSRDTCRYSVVTSLGSAAVAATALERTPGQDS